MDKTIEVIVVAMVAIATATGMIFMVQSQSGSFLDFTEGETSSAKCSLWEETCNEKYNDNCEGTLPSSCNSEDGTEGSPDTFCEDHPEDPICQQKDEILGGSIT